MEKAIKTAKTLIEQLKSAKVYLVLQESNVDGEILKNELVCATKEIAAREMEKEINTILTESVKYKCGSNNFTNDLTADEQAYMRYKKGEITYEDYVTICENEDITPIGKYYEVERIKDTYYKIECLYDDYSEEIEIVEKEMIIK